MTSRDHLVAIGLLIGVLGTVTWGIPSATAAEGDSEGSPTSTSTTPARGSLGLEVVGGAAGVVLGGAAGSLGTLGFVHAGDGGGPGAIYLVFLGGEVGASVVSGLGTGLAGEWTGGNGELGMSVLGSSIGGAAGIIVPVGVGLIVAAATGDNDAFVYAAISTVPLVPVGAVTGGVLGYRWSAQPTSGESSTRRVIPYLVPRADGTGGRAGISIPF